MVTRILHLAKYVDPDNPECSRIFAAYDTLGEALARLQDELDYAKAQDRAYPCMANKRWYNYHTETITYYTREE